MNRISRKDDRSPIATEMIKDIISPMRNIFFFMTRLLSAGSSSDYVEPLVSLLNLFTLDLVPVSLDFLFKVLHADFRIRFN